MGRDTEVEGSTSTQGTEATLSTGGRSGTALNAGLSRTVNGEDLRTSLVVGPVCDGGTPRLQSWEDVSNNCYGL